MIPSPNTPAESAECCLEVLQISMVDSRRLAEIFVDALQTYPDRLHDMIEADDPEDPDELDAFNRLMNRTYGFISFAAFRCDERTAAVRDILRRMREEIALRDGAGDLHEALDIIERGARSGANQMAMLIRMLKKV